MTSVQNSCTDFTAGHSVTDAHTNEALFRFLRKPLLLNISFTLRASIRAQRGFVRYVHALRIFSSFHVAISRCSETLFPPGWSEVFLVIFFFFPALGERWFIWDTNRKWVQFGMRGQWKEASQCDASLFQCCNGTDVYRQCVIVLTGCVNFFFVFFLLTGDP